MTGEYVCACCDGRGEVNATCRCCCALKDHQPYCSCATVEEEERHA